MNDILKTGGIVLALSTAFGSAMYNYGALNKESELNAVSRAEQKIIAENVIEMRVTLEFLNQMVTEMRQGVRR